MRTVENVRKIAIIGISGTGKSVLARRLSDKTGLSLHHMDAMIWEPGWTEAAEGSIRSALSSIAATEDWIVEGWIDTYSKDILQRSDIILYLDYPGWLAACGGVRRWLEFRGRKRPEMPEGCRENFDFGFLRTMLFRRERPHIESLLATLSQPNIVRVRSRHEMEAVFSGLTS